MIVRVLSPAKINLVLRVTGKRPDGYHNLLSLMCRVGLWDEIRLRPRPGVRHVAVLGPHAAPR